MIASACCTRACGRSTSRSRTTTAQSFVGFDNYKTIFTSSDQITVLRNTAVWVIVTPILATLIGLVYAVLIDRARVEKFAKALIFLPMAISLVGASLIWKFVYDYRATENVQIGLANAFLKSDRAGYLPVPAHRTVEHAVPDRHHDLGPGRLRHDGALRLHQGHP